MAMQALKQFLKKTHINKSNKLIKKEKEIREFNPFCFVVSVLLSL